MLPQSSRSNKSKHNASPTSGNIQINRPWLGLYNHVCEHRTVTDCKTLVPVPLQSAGWKVTRPVCNKLTLRLPMQASSKTVRCTGGTADPYAHVWRPQNFLLLQKHSDINIILPNTLTSLRRASRTLTCSLQTVCTLTPGVSIAVVFTGCEAVSGSRHFGKHLIVIVRTQQ
jgi:hypothetical protein